MSKVAKSKPAKTALEKSPSHLMHRALQLALDIYAEESTLSGLTQRQFAVLEAASKHEGLTQTDLVKATGIDRSTLADLVGRMTTKGLLLRERSAVDARAKAVRLSNEGLAALEQARPCVQSADKRILALLPKNKRETFLELLAQLADTADAVPELAKLEAKAAKKAAKEARKARKQANAESAEPKRKKGSSTAETPADEKPPKTEADS